jgi:integrase
MERQVYRLTKRLIEAEQAEMASVGERQRVIWDSDIAGFGCRLSKAGALAFFDYRDAKRTKRRLAIGKVLQVELATGKVLKAELTVEQARSKAAVYRVDVRAGADPLGDRRKSGGGVTVREAMRNWITAKINPKSDRRWSPVTEREYRRILEKDIIPHIGEMPLGELTRQVLMTRVAVVAKRSSSMAAASFRVLGSFVRYCEAMGLTEGLTLPAAKAVASPPRPRTRRPDNDRLVAIWRACEALTPRSAALARLIILTAQRRRSVELLEWHELHFESGRWRIPVSKMKAGRPHEVALSAFAVQQLQGLPKNGPFVFSDTKVTPDRLNRILKTLQAEVGNGWSWHDFRRAFMTWAVANGHPREYAKAALAHQIKDRLDQAYDQHDYAPEAAGVMLGWQRHVEQLVTRGPASKFVSLR